MLSKTDRGWQCSVQRHASNVWGVFIKPTASGALLAALSPEPFVDWETHLGMGGSDLATARSYWHHPESSCVFIIEPGEELPRDGMSVEIDQEDYGALKTQYDDENDFGHLI
jgi:hypothetical protein